MVLLTMFKNAMLLVSVLLVAGCSGITPYDPPDYRDEPPGDGLLTGADGEVVIYRKAGEVEPAGEAIKNKEQTPP